MSISKWKADIRLKWLGCSCFEMDFGDITIVSDPWITPNKKHDLTWEAVEKCDYITLSHGHYDHTLDIPALIDRFQPYVMCGENTAIPLMRWTDINPVKIYPMSPNLELDLGSVKIKALYGRHNPFAGGAKSRREWAENHPVNAGDPELIELAFWGDVEYRNYLFTLRNGIKVLIWGNKLDSPGQRGLLREVKPDVAILQLTPSNSCADLAAICKEIGCKVVIPHHIDFPKDYSSAVKDFERELEKIAPEIRCINPEYGTWFDL